VAYDEELAHRIRAVLAGTTGVSEKRMFGGLGFLVNGNLAASASSRGGMLLRVDPADTDALVAAQMIGRYPRGQFPTTVDSTWTPLTRGSARDRRRRMAVGVARDR
jgi:TfoX/Sxy family transcriptional regulator of competence genes